MSAQPAYQNSKAEEHARYRRRDHADIEAMLNLMLDEIVRRFNTALPEDKHITFPSKLRAFISALQSARGGGRLINEPLARSHEQVAAYLQFKGNREAKEARVRRLINQLDSFQHMTGYMLFYIERGGHPTGEVDAKGNIIYTATTYTDFCLPLADEAMMRARESGVYFGDKAKGIKPARHAALAAQVQWAVDQLPRISQKSAEQPDKPKLSLDAYLIQQGERLLSSFERVFDVIEERHGQASDCLAWLDRQYSETRRALLSREKTYPARRDFTVLDEEEADPTILSPLNPESDSEINGLDFQFPTTAIWRNAESDMPVTVTGDLGLGRDGRRYASIAESSAGVPFDELTFSEPEKSVADASVEPDMLSAALEYVAVGYAVIPCHTPDAAGVCDCREGDKCRSPGKHPRIREWEKCASREPAQIKEWFRKWPHANIGLATGIMSARIVLDVDIEKGGGAGLAALCEKIELPATKEIQTGAGAHFYFASEDEEVRNSSGKLGEGLDVRGNGGFIIAPPSLHASGRRYQKANDLPTAPLPGELRELMLAPTPPQSNVSQFRYRTGQGIGGATLPEGERNDGLFRIGCAIWGKGNAEDLADLHSQLLDANSSRCNPPLDEVEVMKLAANIAGRYARGVPITELRYEQ
jgi:hypothetical protein